MILLLLGWHLSLLGVITVFLGGLTNNFSTAICGVLIGALGIFLGLALGKTCPSFQSDMPEKDDPNRPLDYY